MTWQATPSGKRGRQQTCSDTAVQTCSTIEVLFGTVLRQTTGFAESLLRLVGLKWSVPDFSTLSRRQKTVAASIPYRGLRRPLQRLMAPDFDRPVAELRARIAVLNGLTALGMPVTEAVG